MVTRARRVFLAVVVLGAHFTGVAGVDACAPAPRPGDTVAVAQEEALIVWDAVAKREHFIRRADFQTAASDFGFLVPTPTQPELAEADDGVFVRLRDAIRPEVRWERRFAPQPVALVCLPYFMFGRAMTTAPETGVRVLDTARVAGLDVVVLEADNTAALSGWLKEHGYAWRPAMAAWIAPYVRQKWTITAFKIARGESGSQPRLGTKAVRMTFATERPYFPYREPADTPARQGGAFRVYLVAAGRTSGALGVDARASALWRADTTFARPLTGAATLLAGAVPGEIASMWWLTSFLDPAFKRPDADLWFGPSADRAEVTPPPLTYTRTEWIPIPVDVLLALGLLARWIVRRRRRRAALGA